MKKANCVTAFLVILSAFTSTALAQTQSNSSSLTNKDVTELVKAGLSSEVIVAKIKTSPSNFDTSPAALRELKDAGVPEAIILAMVQAPTGGRNDAPAISPDKPAEKVGVKNLYQVRKIYTFIEGQSYSRDDVASFVP